MKISPVTSPIFTRKASTEEIIKLKKEAESAKSMRTAVEDKTFISVDGGMQAWFRAKNAGFEYADKKPEGKRYRQAWEAYSQAHIHPLKTGEKEAKAEFIRARKAYYNKANSGRELYFFENEEDGAIRKEVIKKMMETEEGRKAILEDECAMAALKAAIYGVLEKI